MLVSPLRVLVILTCAVTLSATASAASQIAQEAYIKAIDPDAVDSFGRTVSVSGDTVVIGSPGDDGPAGTTIINRGAAFVFVRSGSTWSRQAYLIAQGPGGIGSDFGRSVSIDGETLVVNSGGQTRIFVRTGTTWALQQTINGPFPGTSAISGDTLVVGALNEGIGPHAGAAHVYRRVGATWSLEATLIASNSDWGDRFGAHVAISGESIAVSAPDEDGGSSGVNGGQASNSLGGSGAAYVFVRTGTTWTQEAYIKASNPAVGLGFGTLSISGETLVVGCRFEGSSGSGVNGSQDGDLPSSGAAYVFVRDGSTWAQEAYIKAEYPGFGHWFGESVSIDGDTLLVGSTREDGEDAGVNGDPASEGLSGSGACFVYERTGSTWSPGAYLKASNAGAGDVLGIVAIDGDTVVVGAEGEDSATSLINGDQDDNSTSNAGAAYVFNLDAPVMIEPYCFGNACPCGNDDPTAGCVNNNGVGALMGATGSTSTYLDDLVFTTEFLSPGEFGLYFMGTAQTNLNFSNGKRCVAGTSYRFNPPLRASASGTIALGPGIVSTSCASLAPGGCITSGATWNFHTWYRDPGGPCLNSFNTSNAVSVLFTP